jgi:hypothetical protein
MDRDGRKIGLQMPQDASDGGLSLSGTPLDPDFIEMLQNQGED